jgi:alpha-tubulin suppressor-like RCC1 family protein
MYHFIDPRELEPRFPSQLGQDSKQSRLGHVASLSDYNIKSVACGEQHTLALVSLRHALN